MCDLWQNTLTETVSPGLIPQQIDFALQRLPHAPHLKLYNSGNFFDPWWPVARPARNRCTRQTV
ncbi:MAG UNVERIFIED_CONTAM: hypothetical protein LVR18_51130 [Planctomycetaceae bacterium]|jgi:uncharacterized Fe-S cluster-containing MiaB family protein